MYKQYLIDNHPKNYADCCIPFSFGKVDVSGFKTKCPTYGILFLSE